MKNSIRTLIWVAVLLGAATSRAGTWRVEQDGSGDFTTLQPAVDAAASGDTILIGPGWYQEMHQIVDLGGHPVDVFAYLNVDKDMVFIGAGRDLVTFGPESYATDGYGPKGIFGTSSFANSIAVYGVSFQNLYMSVVNIGEITVSECDFRGGEAGIGLVEGRGAVANCAFIGCHYGGLFDYCDTVSVSNCSLEDARVYFGHTDWGIVEDCTVNGGGVANYYQSGGRVSRVEANSSDDPAIECNWSQIAVESSHFTGGMMSISCIGQGSLLEAHDNVFSYPEYHHLDIGYYASLHAWHNEFYRESLGPQYFIKTIGYTNPSDAYIDVGGNYWGPLDSTEHFLNVRIWDGNDDPDLKIIVDFLPIETEPLPTEEQSLDSFKSMFR